MRCPYCNTENRNGGKFCANCGQLMSDSSAINPMNPIDSIASNSPISSPVTPPIPSLAPGSQLQGGRYVIKRVLGHGGIGAALLATDNRLDSKSVVIKELISDSPDARHFQEDVRNFKREVSMLAHIDHPLVPNITDHFQEGMRYFMVQEYVDGETLEERLEHTKHPLRERDVLLYASQVLDILDYLSQQTPPIVHHDIKPANIVIRMQDRRAHLVDFNIARAEMVKNAQHKQTSALGTPGYAPPEQYQGNADPRSDLYALAATMHHLLTNRDPRNYPPFTYPPARILNPQLSVETERVLTHALNNTITQRYQSAATMKQDIDDILLNQFGVSVNGNLATPAPQSNPPDSRMTMHQSPNFSGTLPAVSYTPGTSRTLPDIPPASTPPFIPMTPGVSNNYHYGTPQSVSSAPPIPSVSPMSPVLPASPMQSASPMRPGRHTSRRLRLFPVLFTILILLLLIGGSFAAFSYFSRTHSQAKGNITPTAQTSQVSHGIGLTKIGNDEIGISDGTAVLDNTNTDATFKQQAANALKQNDTSTAIANLDSALAQTPNDAEAHIYLEDLRVLASGSPYVTYVVATMLSPDNIGVGRDDLQGAYIAQKEFNDGSRLSNGFKVRLLIASSGSQAQYAMNVAQQIVQLAQADKTVVGVMGWPFSSRTADAVSILGKAHIPIISQTASSDSLSGISPYFFRVVPPNTVQASAGSHYAEQTLHANTAALFVDNTDPYSQTLAQDFSQQFTKDGKTIVDTETYKVGKTATLPASLQKALSTHPDIIYFSGYASDMSTLLTDLPTGNTTTILGGDALYELDGYNSSARADFSHLRFTAFAYPDEWDILGQAASKPAFFANYAHAYSTNASQVGYHYTRADNDAILSYDATIALLRATNAALASGKQAVTPQDEQQALLHTAFQGVSGQIAFGSNGDPVNKAIVILSVDSKGQIRMVLPVQGKFFS